MKKLLTALMVLGSVACGGDGGPAAYEWNLPGGFPVPRVPEDNPMSEAKIELGRYLFYDKRLSGNQTLSCAGCHSQELSFTDGLARAVGSTGEMTPRGSMSLANVGYAATLTWANPVLVALERQALVPMFGEIPVELGLANREDELLQRMRDDADYPAMFAEAFPKLGDPISVDTIVKSIAAFQRTLISGNSRVDQFARGDMNALTESELHGLDLFFGGTTEAGELDALECFHCHGGFNYSQSIDHASNVFDQASFNNNGLYNLDENGAYPADNPGIVEFTEDPSDNGKFKAPSLRNIAVTAPYMHDGSIATLEEVIDHYAAGGRLIEDGPNAGDGRLNPNKNAFVDGFTLTEQEKADLLAFLRALTDEEFLNNPAFADPFAE